MLENILLHMILPAFINSAFPDSGEMYKSGLGEVEQSYISDKPATDYPMITIDIMTQDNKFNILQPGIYAVDLMPDLKHLLILKGNEVVAECTVIQVIELEDELKTPVPLAEVIYIKDNKVFIKYKNENLEVHGYLYKSDDLPRQ